MWVHYFRTRWIAQLPKQLISFSTNFFYFLKKYFLRNPASNICLIWNSRLRRGKREREREREYWFFQMAIFLSKWWFFLYKGPPKIPRSSQTKLTNYSGCACHNWFIHDHFSFQWFFPMGSWGVRGEEDPKWKRPIKVKLTRTTTTPPQTFFILTFFGIFF